MNKSIFMTGIVATLAIVAISNEVQTSFANHVSTIHEDQFMICSFEEECVVINADDILNDEQIEKIWMKFAYDLDTFPYGVETE